MKTATSPSVQTNGWKARTEKPIDSPIEGKIPSRMVSSNNASFTSSTFYTRETSRLSRFAYLNRSFNNAANMATDIRRKLHEIGSEPTTNTLTKDAKGGGRSVEDFYNAAASANSPSDLMRKLSQRVKHQVSVSLSDPLKGRDLLSKIGACSEACGTCARCQQASGEQSPLCKTSSVKKRVAAISNRLQLPNFAAEANQQQLQNEDDEIASSSDESNDPELLDLEEREQIVEKYEKGPDSQDVDPWENPDFELYKITDRYGFVHKNEPVVSAEEQERRRIEREVKRETKWLRMLEEWKQHHPAKLPERIWKGVPEKLRIVFWKKLLGVEEMKSNARDNLYLELLMRARLISKDIKQIDLDINRTYRDHLAFRKRYDVKQQSLFNVLSAYAMFNTEVGYCQGMSQIAAIFLMYMDEEDAFWCLHSLMVNRKYTMHGFFVPGFPKLHRFQNHHEKVIQKYLPRVKKHFDKAGIPTIYLTKWWFGCFLDRVPFSLAIRVWDVFLYYGDSILIAMAYNIIKMHRKTILKQQLEQFMDFIQTRLAEDFGFTNDRTMESLEECLKRLQSDRMALPPPPNPDDPSEVPTKPLGPSLTRSMIDIRIDIAEIHSRSSRANSLAGRSPAMKRHQTNRKPPSPMPATPAQAQSSTSIVTAVDPALTPTASSPTFNRRDFNQTAKPNLNGEQHYKTPSTTDQNISRQLADSFRRVPSTKAGKNGRPLPPPVPDADGFIPMSPRQSQIARPGKRVQSYYDNVSSSNPNYIAAGNVTSSLANTNHSRETSADRVRRAPNNVTYVAVGGGSQEGLDMSSRKMVSNKQPPHCPPPDYPEDDDEEDRREPYENEWNRESIRRQPGAEYAAANVPRWQGKRSPTAQQYGYYPSDYQNNRQPNSSITRRF
uniref:Rab-GAP TBC domain-containing protein n=1 Tax=Ditylenchus dipsaci TaxID=166011 RepID=A0A915DQC0_9BILA